MGKGLAKQVTGEDLCVLTRPSDFPSLGLLRRTQRIGYCTHHTGRRLCLGISSLTSSYKLFPRACQHVCVLRTGNYEHSQKNFEGRYTRPASPKKKKELTI